MKKLSIGLILLGLLSFLPQLANADGIYIPTLKEKYLSKKSNIENELCFLDKKSSVSKDYIGGNLKIQKFPCLTSSEYPSNPIIGFRNNYLTDIDLKDQGFPGHRQLWVYVENSIPKNLPKKHIITGLVCNCNEYLWVGSGTRSRGEYYSYGYDITNVPPGSYLKYIPETKEIQVIPYSEGSYEDIIKDGKEQLEHSYYIHSGNTYEILPLTQESYKKFVEIEQSKLNDNNLKIELEQKKAGLKKEIIKDKNFFREIIKIFRGAIIPFLIALIITSVLKGICSIPFGKRFCYLVLITNLITISLSLICILYCQIGWDNICQKDLDSPLILVLILTIIPLEWGILSIFSQIKHLKLLKSFLFALISNIIAYGFGLYLFVQIMTKYHL